MMIVQHILVFFLIVVSPLWDLYEIPRLKASTRPRKKIRFYQKIVIASWICAIVALLTVGFMTVFHTHVAAGEMGWLDPGARGRLVLEGIMAGMLIALVLPVVLALVNEKVRAKAGKAAKRLAFLVPSTNVERQWWWLVCITAGICEEIVYRGFLLHYFHTLPFHLSLTWALIVSSAVFGVGHLYQGIAGFFQSAVIGFLLGAIFVMTGSLLVPMVVHALTDLRILALVPQGFETAEV